LALCIVKTLFGRPFFSTQNGKPPTSQTSFKKNLPAIFPQKIKPDCRSVLRRHNSLVMDMTVNSYEEKNKKKGMVISIIVHILLIILALLPLLTFPDPPPGQEGVLVNLGIPDVGEGEENAPPVETQPQEEQQEVTPEESTVAEPEEEVVKEDPKPVKAETPKKDVVKTEDPEAIALRKKKEAEKQKQREEARKKAEEEARKRKAAEEARRKREEEARRKAEEQKKYEESKSKFGGMFGGGNGSGKGNTGKPGNQGDPNGDPNSNILEGISTGKGRVGGGLGSRGVQRAPSVTDNSQKTGVVVIELCVDSNGNVIGTPRFTQKGSTTADARLIQLAISNAKKWKFAKASIDKQCGTIKYDFKVK